MNSEPPIEYYQSRERQELHLAQAAASTFAADRHLEMASRYYDLIQQSVHQSGSAAR